MQLKKLYLELTDRCNLQCTICYRQSWHDPYGDMAASVYRKLMEEIHTLPQIQTVVLGGLGEPTCSPFFSDALKALQDKEVILTTNGQFDTALLPDLSAYANTVVLSLDGLPDTHQRVRGTSPDLLTANVRQLRELRKTHGTGPQILLQCVLSTETLPDALQLVDFAADLGADGLVFSHLMPQLPENRDKILYSRHGDHPSCYKTFDALRIRALRRGLRLTLPPLELKTERFCSFIEDATAYVCASGAVAPCYRLSHDYTEYVFGRKKSVRAHSFGTVKNNTLVDIWHSEAYHLFRQRVFGGRYPSCPDCDLVDGCDYVASSDADCWCTTPSCADCLWSRRLVVCP